MTTITIPRLNIREEFIAVPRQEYDSLMRLKKARIQEVILTAKQRHAIAQSDKELKKGSHLTLNELERYLARSYSKARR